MSWSTKRFFGFLMGTAVAGSVLVGCAGDAEIPLNVGTPVIPASGGVVQSRGTSNESRPSQPFPQQVQVTREDATVVSGALPSNTPMATGEEVAVIEGSTPLIDGLQPVGRAPGDILIYDLSNSNPRETGVHLMADGRLSGPIVLPNGDYRVSVSGPLAVVRGGNRLDIRTIVLQIAVRNGRASLPTSVNGELPVNGGSSFPLRLNANGYPATFNGGFATLNISHDNGLLRQTKQIAGGNVQFHDIVFAENSVIPRTGVNTVELIYTDTNPNND